ncbi:M-phase inducer phosphatase [Trichuris trichiura]|uniref:protein-tyrosine-phosphatase n=1 Tax=Trichuris trichiura TaxID=36087 RepID=A0A077ZIC1_TRITR|nr:M-phase inducer phosphatase [Trichuris trichiura]
MLSITGVEEMQELAEKFTEISIAVKSTEVLINTEGKHGLIADYSDSFALPYFSSPRVPDLPQISDTVLVELIEGQFQDSIASFLIIDCRYPYEYNGGHIRTAVNVHTAQDFNHVFFDTGKVEHIKNGRNIIIFYCEYSLERGPAMFRRLRDADRVKHKLQYPMLQYPEMYLLSGGYKKFFNNHANMCSPPNYVEMTNEKYGSWSECRQERAVSFCDKRRNSEPIPSKTDSGNQVSPLPETPRHFHFQSSSLTDLCYDSRQSDSSFYHPRFMAIQSAHSVMQFNHVH